MPATADAPAPDQSTTPPATVTKSKLRYPLRSATKPKDDKVNAADAPTATARRIRPPVTVRSSASVLSITARDNNSSAASRNPRRFSVPSKVAVGPREVPSSPTSNGSGTTAIPTQLTPDSESNGAAVKGSKPETARMANGGRKKFSVLSSVSYWMSQIKVAESAAKHKISLGFFRLALESGCEPVQRMREELRSYAVKHNVVEEMGDPARELLQTYGIVEDLEKLNLGPHETDNQQPQLAIVAENVPERGKECSNRDSSIVAAAASSPRTGRGLMKPRSLNPLTPRVSEATKKDGARGKAFPAAAAAKNATTRTLQSKNDAVKASPRAGAADGTAREKKTFRRSRSDLMVRTSVRKSTAIEKDALPATTPSITPVVASMEDVAAENKENQENNLEEAVAMEIITQQEAA